MKLTRKIGWRTFRGMVRTLKAANKRLQKLGTTGEFTVKLPLK